MSDEQFDNEVRQIFGLPHGDKVHIRHNQHATSGKLFTSIIIDDGKITKDELYMLFSTLKRARYEFKDAYTLDGRLVFDFDKLDDKDLEKWIFTQDLEDITEEVQ